MNDAPTTSSDTGGEDRCPKRGEIREINGVMCRFIERELEGDKWEILATPTPRKAEGVLVPRAWLESFRRDTDPTEPIADNGGTVWDMFCHDAERYAAAPTVEVK